MAEETLLPIKLEPILQQIQENVPTMIKGRDAAVAAMKNITEINSDEDLENVNRLLVKVRSTYDKVYAIRTGITTSIDQTKEFLMQFEKDLDQNGKNNDVVRLRGLMGQYKQKILDENNRIKREAEIQKLKENHKADVIARIKKNLADMVIARAAEVQSGSKKFFDDTTLEDWDAKAKTFMSFRPVLKTETYNKCFQVSYNPELLPEKEFLQLTAEIGAEETYVVWDAKVADVVAPILNDWRGRMDDIKQDKIKLRDATESEKSRIEKEQKAKADHDEQVRKDQIAEMQKESDHKIEQEKQVDKLQNDFREQAVTQKLDDAGPVKLIAKFKEDKPVKTLTEVLYHCFMSPKFPDITKKDKNKNTKINEHGFPEYIDSVDYFLSFFLKYCDVNINGIEIKEVSKVIVRKD